MAHLYVGDPMRLDTEVVQALGTLPDDFWVLAEFNIKRNYDFVIIRPVPWGLATFVVTELKRVGRSLRGTTNGVWEEQLPDGSVQPVATANREDRNYYFQAVNAANSLSEYLRNNDPVISPERRGTWSHVKVWPDLLLLSPESIEHRLPLRPDNNYGMWFYDLDQWLQHLRNWRSREGAPLTEEDVLDLVRHLELTPLDTPSVPAEQPAVAVPAGEPIPEPLAARLDRMDARLERIERALAQLTRVRPMPAPPVAEPPFRASRRPLSDVERDAIVRAVQSARDKGYVRSFPTIVGELERLLGEDLKAARYRGFGTARAFFDEALQEGIIRYGEPSGPAPTILLPDELSARDF